MFVSQEERNRKRKRIRFVLNLGVCVVMELSAFYSYCYPNYSYFSFRLCPQRLLVILWVNNIVVRWKEAKKGKRRQEGKKGKKGKGRRVHFFFFS